MADLKPVLADLEAESGDLDASSPTCPTTAWARATPRPGWTIAHQIAHLAWTDDVATLAITDPRVPDELQRRSRRCDPYVDAAAEQRDRGAAGQLLAAGGPAARALADALLDVPDEHEDRLVRAADVARRRWRPRG